MTDVERKAWRHLFLTMKATRGRSDVAAQREAQEHKIHSRMLSDEPQVLILAKNGYEQFQMTKAARILRDSADKVIFNYCPRCEKTSADSYRKAVPPLRSRLAWDVGGEPHLY